MTRWHQQVVPGVKIDEMINGEIAKITEELNSHRHRADHLKSVNKLLRAENKRLNAERAAMKAANDNLRAKVNTLNYVLRRPDERATR